MSAYTPPSMGRRVGVSLRRIGMILFFPLVVSWHWLCSKWSDFRHPGYRGAQLSAQEKANFYDPLTLVPAVELARRIRAGEVTSTAVVDAYCRQAGRVNAHLNALVVERFDRARREAAAVDAAIARGDAARLGPFAGVPITLKECFAFAGHANTSGIIQRASLVAEADSPVVARLLAAGFIVLGTTNLSEGCMWFESYNRLYGRTNNPYDLRRTPGGSSGGEGAMVGAAGSLLGLSSDVGGSTRMPAFFGGVFGHKPSPGLVPNTGQYPNADGAGQHILCTGPITRYAADLMPMLRVMAGPEPGNTYSIARELGDPLAVRLRGLRVLNCPSPAGRRVVTSSLSADMAAARDAAASHLAAAGCAVSVLELPELRAAFDMWSARMDVCRERTFLQHIGLSSRWAIVPELFRWLAGSSAHTLPALLLGLLEPVAGLARRRRDRLSTQCLELRERLCALLGDDGVLLFPSFPHTAAKHHAQLLAPFDFIYAGIFNALGLPVTQVPMGLDARGLPLGVQVVAADGRDHVAIAVALELERRVGGWVPPYL